MNNVALFSLFVLTVRASGPGPYDSRAPHQQQLRPSTRSEYYQSQAQPGGQQPLPPPYYYSTQSQSLPPSYPSYPSYPLTQTTVFQPPAGGLDQGRVAEMGISGTQFQRKTSRPKEVMTASGTKSQRDVSSMGIADSNFDSSSQSLSRDFAAMSVRPTGGLPPKFGPSLVTKPAQQDPRADSIMSSKYISSGSSQSTSTIPPSLPLTSMSISSVPVKSGHVAPPMTYTLPLQQVGQKGLMVRSDPGTRGGRPQIFDTMSSFDSDRSGSLGTFVAGSSRPITVGDSFAPPPSSFVAGNPSNLGHSLYSTGSSSTSVSSSITMPTPLMPELRRRTRLERRILPKSYQPINISGQFLLVAIKLDASLWKDVSRELGGKRLAVIQQGRASDVATVVNPYVSKKLPVLVGSSMSEGYSTNESEFVYIYPTDGKVKSSKHSKECAMLFEADQWGA